MICKCNSVTAFRQPKFFTFPNSKNFQMMKTLQNKNPKGRNGKYKKKNSIRSFTELKKKTVLWFFI